MDAHQAPNRLLSRLEPLAATALYETATTRVLSKALALFRQRKPLGLSLRGMEGILASIPLNVGPASPEEEERLAVALVDLLVKQHRAYRSMGFEYAEDALKEYARRLF